MNFLEKDLEQIIYETRNDVLQKKGLLINGIKKRQLKIGNYGIADIVTFTRGNYLPIDFAGECFGGFNIDPYIITIYELKQNKISVSSFLQAIRYAKGVKNYLDKRGTTINYEIRICLIGKEIDLSTDFIYLLEFIDNIDFITYSYDVDGILFTSHADKYYSLINEGF